MAKLNLWGKLTESEPSQYDDEGDDAVLISPFQRDEFLKRHIFIHTHVAKAGGTTLTNGVASIVGWGSSLDRRPRPVRYNPRNLSPGSIKALRFYTGHMLYGEHEFFNQKPLYMMSLRDPVSRFVSHYRFVTSSKDHPALERIEGTTLPEAFDIELEANVGSAANGQCRHISGDRKLRGVTGQSAIQMIKDNYFLATPMGQIDRAVAGLREAFDLPRIEPVKMNVGRGPKVEIDAELEARIRAANSMDIEVETWVRENFDEMLEKACDYVRDTCRSF